MRCVPWSVSMTTGKPVFAIVLPSATTCAVIDNIATGALLGTNPIETYCFKLFSFNRSFNHRNTLMACSIVLLAKITTTHKFIHTGKMKHFLRILNCQVVMDNSKYFFSLHLGITICPQSHQYLCDKASHLAICIHALSSLKPLSSS